MASESFSYMYAVGGGDEQILAPYVLGYPFVIAETSDDDGVFRLGEEIDGGALLFKGYTADGDILLLNQIENVYYFYSNFNDLEGRPLSTLSVLEQDYIFCFVRGTAISTPSGPVPVEDLTIGDEVLNASGAAIKVKWIGRQTCHPLFATVYEQLPIRIDVGALGNGLPVRDLYVSPDHAMLIEGCLVHASALVNGRTIHRMVKWSGNLDYFHIETENHELILAEGAQAETFIDNVSRERFDNYAEYALLYPNAKSMVELDLPRVVYKRQLPLRISRRQESIADDLMGKMAVAA